MSLSVYVMPVWRFKAGDFASPLTKLGIGPVIEVSPGGMTVRSADPKIGFVTRWKARRATRSLRREIEAEIGHAVRLNDEGAVEYAEQAYGFEALRAFAAWLDCRDRLPTFDAPPENNYYNHPAMSADLGGRATCPQIVDHSCYSGYFIPAELERVVYVEPYTAWGKWEFKHSVGSTPRLLGELEHLSRVLADADIRRRADPDAIADVDVVFTQLYHVAKISRDKDLPIIFHG